MMRTRYDTTMIRGSTFRRTFVLRDADGNIIDLTDHNVRSYMRQTYQSQDKVDLNASILNAAGGVIGLHVTAEVTELIAFAKGVYDIELVFPEVSGERDVQQIIYGKITIEPEATHDR